jgi:hypothetical protein
MVIVILQRLYFYRLRQNSKTSNFYKENNNLNPFTREYCITILLSIKKIVFIYEDINNNLKKLRIRAFYQNSSHI